MRSVKPSCGPSAGWTSATTIILHTANRPRLLARNLSYVADRPELAGVKIDVIDGSTDQHWPGVERVCRSSGLAGLTIHHSEHSLPFRERLAAALHRCSTPYLMLAADDDFYLPGWMEEGARMLDDEPDLAIVHGHTLFFSVEGMATLGPLARFFVHPRNVPPLRWLEADRSSERVRELSDGTHEPASVWYALRRTSHLRELVDAAVRVELPDPFYEYWMLFYQTVLGKTRMLDRIVLARQEDDKAFRRSPTVADSAEWLALMQREFVALLQAHETISPNEAEQVVDRYLSGVASELRRLGDRGALLRLRAHPVTRFLARHLLRRPALARDTRATHYPDPRLPPIPKVDDNHPAVELVRRATRSRD